MRTGVYLYSILRLVLALALLLSGSAFGNEDPPMYYLTLSSIGFPTAEKQKDARKINELKIFEGRLYLGHGDATVNTGPTDIIYYDLATDEFISEFTIDDEAIHRYQVVDGKLVIPGPDATEGWNLGNVYVLTGAGWVKHRTVPHAIHVNQVASFHGKWFVSTGSYLESGKNQMSAFGGILCSDDEGKTWKLVYATPSDDKDTFRVDSLVPYREKLYAFSYAYRSMKKQDVPEEYRQYLGEAYGGVQLILVEDVFGGQEATVYDGHGWQTVDLIREPELSQVRAFVFRDQLVISALFGKYVDYLSLREGIPGHVRIALYAFDGEIAKQISLEYDLIRDVLPKDDVLFLLLRKSGRYFIAESPDLKKWTYYLLPEAIGKPKSLEYYRESFYIGMADGNIFRSTHMEKISDPSQAEGRQPHKIYGAAELPRDGKWY